ncbi:uncharacterized protein MAM_03165 [Metarhizium album ARSEF 1941]|uniref:HNH nuclease domain-containing protein n=1 Tax=Metarhizium album (strain ARSEF 1941) TaxID=1081103 RepID=A0A0B2WXD8_METAS|nr:uncharacterized protein MAM_03165 [Metarhizium album ARSEF 1941]KHN98703.1 hypothetical protein MAM_03165 [Metarhizium album ARSEF 1941]
MAEIAHIIPQSHDEWYTNNAMCDYSRGARAHSLAPIAPEPLFARFSLTVLACVMDFILRGERRRIAMVQCGIDANGGPAWATQELKRTVASVTSSTAEAARTIRSQARRGVATWGSAQRWPGMFTRGLVS